MILQLKNINFTTIKKPIMIDNVDIDKILISTKISSGGKKYKYLISYKGDG